MAHTEKQATRLREKARETRRQRAFRRWKEGKKQKFARLLGKRGIDAVKRAIKKTSEAREKAMRNPHLDYDDGRKKPGFLRRVANSLLGRKNKR